MKWRLLDWGANCFEQLTSKQLNNLEPEISENFDSASYFSGEAVLSNENLFSALNAGFEKQDVNWKENCEINNLSEVNKLGEFDWVVDCRGMGAADSNSDLRGVRGEVIRVYAPEVNIQRPIRLMHPRYPLYIAPHGNHHYVIGATEIESDAMHGVTVRSGLELLSALYSVHRGFAEAEIVSMTANCRPAYANNLPKIRVKDQTMSINGLYRHGFLFGPAIIAEASNYIDEKLDQLKFENCFEIDLIDERNEIFG